VRCDETAAPATGPRDFLWLGVPAHFSVGAAACERLPAGQLQDAPFYARYVARLRDATGRYLGVGEYLDLDRFRQPAVQRLLAFKTHLHPELP
jgi:hypothetical protein